MKNTFLKKITEMTPEQEQQMIVFRDEWLAIGRATGAANREVVEPIIIDFYQRIGKEKPVFWYCQSPFQTHVVAHLMQQSNIRDNIGANIYDNIRDNIGANIYDNIRDNIGDNIRDNIGDNIRDNIRDNIWANIWANIGANIRDNIGANIGANIYDNIGDNIRDNIRYQLTYLWGSYDAYWIAWGLFPHRYLRSIHTDEQMKTLNQFADLARHSGIIYTYENMVIVCDRPSEIHLDERGRLHNPDDMALKFSDGWGLWMVNGVRVPEWIITQKDTINPEKIINENNAEVRRVMINFYGEQRFIADAGKLVHEDEYGKLYRMDFRDDEPICMVRVVNSTPESPNDTDTFEYREGKAFKVYWLGVPPICQTAQEAVAWTFGMSAQDYLPTIES